MMVIGLTGGIGSGKSTVAKVFEAMGCIVYNSDERAKAVYFEDTVMSQVIGLLGENAYRDATTLNKEFISSTVFTDQNLLEKLNAIIHPAVKIDFSEFIAGQKKESLVIKESALLFEAGIYKDLDASILVIAPEELKIERVMKRNQISREEVLKRISSQWTDAHKIKLADYIITNDAANAVIPQVASILESLKKAHA